ncbi:MAG: ATP-grasp fold amidoligase family protein [Christensenellales bacterium]|jgi:hypothetical protein
MKNKLRQMVKKYPNIYSCISKIRKFINEKKEFFRSLRYGFLAKYFPKRHCWLMTRPGGRKETPFKINLDNPRYFNEKLLWLKYYVYNQSPLIAKCYDKFLVREYVKKCGCGHILNELYGVWDSINDVEWDKTPEECVIKVTNGCAYHVFKRKGQKVDIDYCRKTLREPAKKRAIIYRASGDLYALKCPQRVICERLLSNSLSDKGLDDWKFYCFNGEPKYLLYIYNRAFPGASLKKSGYQAVFMTADFDERSSYYKDSSGRIPEKPVCYEEMLECARKLSKDFPFVRVDLYVCNQKPVFGELTFTPAGGYVQRLIHNKEGLTEMGNGLNLNDIGKYTKLKKDYYSL